MTNIFEQAVKQKLRFQSDRGLLTTEQLYDLSLQALDKVARAVNTELKSVTEESFVSIRPNPLKDELTLKLDVLRQVIADLMAAQAAKELRAERAAKRRLLLETLEAKENDELKNLSKEEILKKLEELDA